MARISHLRIKGYRSIDEQIEIVFPERQPVVLVGENNAGKSNIVKSLQLVLGPFWPGNRDPDDHEFFDRSRDHPIEITVVFDGGALFGDRWSEVVWRYDPRAAEPAFFRGRRTGFMSDEGYVSNNDRDTCMCVVVEAERNLHYQTGYSSKWTLLSRLMHRFHRAMLESSDVKVDLETLFSQIKAKFHDVPQFSAFADDLAREVEDLVGSMPHRLQVDFEAYNPVNFFHALRLQAAEGDEPRSLEEMGTGEQQVLALAFAHAYARAFHGGIVLVIEEPESHLHPLAQRWLARRLKAKAEEGLQLLVTTHSPSFIDMEWLEGMVLVHKEGATRVRQLSRHQLVDSCIRAGAPPERVTVDSILPFYAANATIELLSGFFARAIVLVEGPTEALALPGLFASRGLEVERDGIAVLPVGGKGNLAKWCRLYQAFGIPCYLVFDNDPQDDDAGEKRRDALRAVGLVAEEATEILGADDWMVAATYTIFGTDFETSLRAHFERYADLEQEARSSGVDSKPFVARWVVERLESEDGSLGWNRVDRMIEHIKERASAFGEGPSLSEVGGGAK